MGEARRLDLPVHILEIRPSRPLEYLPVGRIGRLTEGGEHPESSRLRFGSIRVEGDAGRIARGQDEIHRGLVQSLQSLVEGGATA